MTEMFSIARASLRMGRAAWHLALPSGAKLVLLCILSHYNDARGCAFPSLARLARMCDLHKRTVQAHITLLEQKGVLQVSKTPGLSTNVYRINEAALAPPPSATDGAGDAENLPIGVAFFAPKGGDFSGQCAEIATHNGSNGIQRQRKRPLSPAHRRHHHRPHRPKPNHPLPRHPLYFCNPCPAHKTKPHYRLGNRYAKPKTAPPCPMRCNASNC